MNSSERFTAEMLLSTIVEELVNINKAGYYDIIFMSNNPFLTRPDLGLMLQVTNKGEPYVMFSDNQINMERFIEKLKSHLYIDEAVFRPESALVIMARKDDGGIEWAAGWRIESNGHLSPAQVVLPQISVNDEELRVDSGWTIASAQEIMDTIIHSDQLVITASEQTLQHANNKFNIVFNINGQEHIIRARQRGTTSEFYLDREEYPTMFLTLINASYHQGDVNMSVIIGNQEWNWYVKNGIITPQSTENAQEGWDITVTEQEREEIMKSLQTAMAEMEKQTAEPQKSNNAFATKEQEEFLSSYIDDNVGLSHLFIYFETAEAKKMKYSTRVDTLVDGAHMIEHPELIEFIMNDLRGKDEGSAIVVQSLTENEDQAFSFNGWKLQDKKMIPMSTEETLNYVM